MFEVLAEVSRQVDESTDCYDVAVGFVVVCGYVTIGKPKV